MKHPPKLVTVGIISAEVGVPVDRVCRILRNRPDLQPKAYAGTVRLFDNNTITSVRQEVSRQEARRAGRGHVH